MVIGIGNQACRGRKPVSQRNRIDKRARLPLMLGTPGRRFDLLRERSPIAYNTELPMVVREYQILNSRVAWEQTDDRPTSGRN